MKSGGDDPGELAQGIRESDARALARAISWIEDSDERVRELWERLENSGGRAETKNTFRVGITGAAGVGKSSLIARLLRELRDAGKRVAVLAVDPTSPQSGGALLGDRLRMRGFDGDEGVYIRSLATRGGIGGVASALPEALELLEHARFDLILIETIGAGQLDTAVAEQSDLVILLLSPESGDVIQFLKGGVMELVDLLVVNKSDRPGAELMLSAAGEIAADQGKPPPLAVSATTGAGIAELRARIEERRQVVSGGKAESGGQGGGAQVSSARVESRARARMVALARQGWLRECERRIGGERAIAALAREVAAGKLPMRSAVADLVKKCFRSETGSER